MHHIDLRHIAALAKEHGWSTGTRLVAYAIAATGAWDAKSLCDITGLRKSAVYAALRAIRDHINALSDSAYTESNSVYAENVNTNTVDASACMENVSTDRVTHSVYAENHSVYVENVNGNPVNVSAYAENVITEIVYRVDSKKPLLPPSSPHTPLLPPISPLRECSLGDECNHRDDGNISSSEKMSDYGNDENTHARRHENSRPSAFQAHSDTPRTEHVASMCDTSRRNVNDDANPVASRPPERRISRVSDDRNAIAISPLPPSRSRRKNEILRSAGSDPEMPPTPSRAAAPVAGQTAPPARPGAIDARRGVTDTWRVWCAYASAYERRYGARPPSSARTNSMCRQLIQRVGIDIALRLAEWYVDARGYYERAMHPLGLLLRDAEVLAAQMQVWPHGLPPHQTIEALAPPSSTTETLIDALWYGHDLTTKTTKVGLGQ